MQLVLERLAANALNELPSLVHLRLHATSRGRRTAHHTAVFALSLILLRLPLDGREPTTAGRSSRGTIHLHDESPQTTVPQTCGSLLHDRFPGPGQVREVLCCDAVASQFVPYSEGLLWYSNQDGARNPSPKQTPQSRPRADMSMLRYRCMPGNSIVRCSGKDRIKYPGRCLQSHFFRNRHSGALG